MPPARKNKGTACEKIADRFGGFVPFSKAIGVSSAAVKQWNADPSKARRGRNGAIPDKWFPKIIAEAKKRGIKLRPQDLVNI